MIISCSEYENCNGCPKNDGGECALQSERKEEAEKFKKIKDSLHWEATVLLGIYAKRIVEKAVGVTLMNKVEDDSVTALYADALLLNFQIGYGLVLPIDDFYEFVKNGAFIDSDGIADFYSREGLRLNKPCRCDLSLIETAKSEGAVFVAWFNK